MVAGQKILRDAGGEIVAGQKILRDAGGEMVAGQKNFERRWWRGVAGQKEPLLVSLLLFNLELFSFNVQYVHHCSEHLTRPSALVRQG
jgi:hypothetical protein